MFKLRRPCAKCPFRIDVPGYLRRARATEIATDLAGGSIFFCHETTVDGVEEDEYGAEVETLVGGENSQFCAGALLVMEKMGVRNQAFRMAERLDLLDVSKLDMSAPVARSFLDFIDHHSEPDEVEREPCSVVNEGCLAPAGMLVGGAPVSVEPEGEVHNCEGCGEPVCDECSDEGGLCFYCAEREG